MYTHSVSHAHFLCTFSLRDVQTLCTRTAQNVFSVHVAYLHLALSTLMFHYPSLLFAHGHFDTTFPSAPSSSSFTRPKSAGQARFRTSSCSWPRTLLSVFTRDVAIRYNSDLWRNLSQRACVGASVTSAEVKRAMCQGEVYTQIVSK